MALHSDESGTSIHDFVQYLQSSDPGAVGAGKMWLDTTTPSVPILKRRNDADSGWITLATAGSGSPHAAATVADTSSIDMTISGQQISAAIIDEYVQDVVGAMATDGTGINFTYNDGANTLTAEPIFAGTGSAGTVAHSDHTHAAGGAVITVQEGDSDVDTAVTTLDFDASDFNVTSSPAGEANIALAYGTSTGTPAEGNHTHAAGGITGVVTGFSVNLGDGTNVITSSEAFVLARMPVAFTWTAWYIQADASGSIVVEVERATSGSPTSFSSIAGTAKPTLSSAQSNSDTSLASWGDTTTDAGDIIKVYVSGTPSTVKRVAVHFALTRSV